MEAGPRWMPLAVEMIDNNFAVMMYNALDRLSGNGSDVNPFHMVPVRFKPALMKNLHPPPPLQPPKILPICQVPCGTTSGTMTLVDTNR